MSVLDRLRGLGRILGKQAPRESDTASQRAIGLVEQGNGLESEGHFDEALHLYERAAQVAPTLARVQLNRGNALLALGRPDEAIGAYTEALALDPGYAAAYFNLGNVHARLGRVEAAMGAYRKAIDLRPDFPAAETALGACLGALGRTADAIECHRRAIALDADCAEAHNNLGLALKDSDLAEATSCFRRATVLRPEDASAHNNLGAALKATSPAEAEASFRRAIALDPAYAEAHNNLGATLKDLGRADEAMASFSRALAIAPDFADAYCNLGVAQHVAGRLEEAAASYRRAVELDPRLALAHNNLAITLTELGQLDAARAALETALAISPNNPGLRSNLLFIQNYLADEPVGRLLEAARDYGELVERLADPFTTWSNARDPLRRLRVGIVSGDMRNHPVGYFTESAFAAIAHGLGDELELVAYANQVVNDEVTARMKASFAEWHACVGLSDRQLAERIRGDHIDILLDLSGHNAANRLPAFAWKPAPIQATWLGYFATTGVRAIDYVVADPIALPMSEQPNFSEKIWHLPETRLCFTAPDVRIAVSPLPALGNGFVTFGCFNHFTKVNERVISLWAELLRQVHGSRLFLKSSQFGDAAVREGARRRFATHGIAAERLVIEGRSPLAEYLAAYGRVDIALDPFPYTGGATTAQALWMGVPVLTLAGTHFVARQGVGMLANMGMSDWVAANSSDYVRLGVAHSRDLDSLARARETLRERALASPVFDAPRFARHLAAGLRAMWADWCLRG